MSRSRRLGADLPSGVWERMERVLAAFEDAWRRGERPDLAHYLPRAGPNRLPLLVELAHGDLEYRLRAGEAARAEDYLWRFPELAGHAGAAADLIAAEWRLRRGETGEYLRRFPQYRELLQSRLAGPPAESGEAGRQTPSALVGGTLPGATVPPVPYVPPVSPANEPPAGPDDESEDEPPSGTPPPAPGRAVVPVRCGPLGVGVLVLLALGAAAGYAVTYRAYHTAEARAREAERAERERQADLQREQAELARSREETAKADATRNEERRRRERAESDLFRAHTALYAGQLAGARRLLADGDAATAAAVLARCRPDLRHWEWRYLEGLCRRDADGPHLDHYFADDGGDRAVPMTVVGGAFTPDGKSLVTAAHDAARGRSELRLWDLATRRPVRTFRCPGSLCSAPVLSADGRLLAARAVSVGGGTPSIRLWVTATGAEAATLRREGHEVAAMAFGPDDGWLVTRGTEGATRFWDTATGRERGHADGPPAAAVGVAVRPDGAAVVSAGGAVQVLDPTGRVVKEPKAGDFRAVAAAYSPDGKWLALSGLHEGRPAVLLWHAGGDEELLTLRDLGGEIAFSADGRYLVALGPSARLWDRRTGRARVLAGVRIHALHPDGRRALVSRDGRFEVRELEPPAEYRVVAGAGGAVPLTALYGPPVLSGDGRRLAAAGADGRVRVWDLASGRELYSIAAPSSAPPALSHDGARLAAAGRMAGTVVVRSADTGAERCAVTCRGVPTRLTLSSTGAFLAVVAAAERGGTELTVWETATGRKLLALDGGRGAFRSLVFSPDERRLFDCTPAAGSTARAWDLATGRTAEGGPSLSAGFAPVFSPDGTRFACYRPAEANRGGEVCVGDAGGGAVRWARRPDADDVTGLAFSPDGRRLAAACGRGGRVRVWETETGQELLPLAAHAHHADAVGFGPDARRLLTIGQEAMTAGSYTVKGWDGP